MATGQEDTDFVLELNGTDIDGDALTFLASVDANGSVSVEWFNINSNARCRL